MKRILFLLMACVPLAMAYTDQDLIFDDPFSYSGGRVAMSQTSPVLANVVKTTSTFTATGTTLASIPNLNYTLTANATYQFDCYIIFQTTTTTTGGAFGMLTPSAPTFIAYTVEIPVAADGTSGQFQGWGTSSGDKVTGTGVQAVNTNYVAHIYGVVIPSQGGDLVAQAASEFAGNNNNIQSRSMCLIRRY